MKQRWARILLYAVLVGWCLLFLRCETTEKSMIRVVYLEQKEQTWSVGLLYQSPEAAADAAEASAALRIADGRGQTSETALAAAEAALPQTADYRLCDYVLFPEQTEDAVLAAYENLVLERGCGRTAARLSCTEFDLEILLQSCGKTETLPDKLLDKLKADSAAMPRLYAHEESMLLPVLCLPEAQEGKVMVSGSGAFRTGSGAVQRLTENETEAFLLLTGTPGKRTFWLQGKRVTIRRCTVSVALRKQTATLRLDCQTAYGTPQPDAAQCQQLEELCLGVVRSCWQQGTDLLHLQEERVGGDLHDAARTSGDDQERRFAHHDAVARRLVVEQGQFSGTFEIEFPRALGVLRQQGVVFQLREVAADRLYLGVVRPERREEFILQCLLGVSRAPQQRQQQDRYFSFHCHKHVCSAIYRRAPLRNPLAQASAEPVPRVAGSRSGCRAAG